MQIVTIDEIEMESKERVCVKETVIFPFLPSTNGVLHAKSNESAKERRKCLAVGVEYRKIKVRERHGKNRRGGSKKSCSRKHLKAILYGAN